MTGLYGEFGPTGSFFYLGWPTEAPNELPYSWGTLAVKDKPTTKPEMPISNESVPSWILVTTSIVAGVAATLFILKRSRITAKLQAR